MFGEHIAVRAEVANVPRFSAHADADQIIDWVQAALDGDVHAGRIGTTGQGFLHRRTGQGAFQRVSSVT
ncbi:MBL fold metallo-hydrolase RNA specificity domain-containing protein [Streptomyces sp. ME02-6991-2A]|uniref:MBL fold metallo-hydrolase RNA specificity domain-containing protein n=1 Tax=Streptomyces sp. ME02-6991-2A TaxID=3028677 RepID=UPI0029BA2C21|nr:MBL fold metallo-hydrolase RNA specificity domain-containing protein [Streptomyces sp. ME02-6991-2A]MDX3378837.1 MBL fold metallo-hydrolase RNA specificity domain-containing protein [Streptomyces sp. ME02-6991-2A]